MITRILPLLVATILVTSCSGITDAFREDDKLPLEGERISVLELQKNLEPDDALLEAQGLMTPAEWRSSMAFFSTF